MKHDEASPEELRWDDLRVLLAVHRHQSFRAAGASLGLSTSTTARRIEVLEAALGRAVVVRTTRGTRIEPGALPLVALAESLELGLGAARRSDRDVGGTVRISCGDGFAGPLVPVLADLRRRAPAIAVELIGEARLADVARGEADLAIRTSRTRSAMVIERRLGRLTFALYGSREYVERRVRSVAVARSDLERLDYVGVVGPQENAPQAKWLASLGAKRFVFRANTDALVLDAVRQSQGLAVLAELVGDADPMLQRLDVVPAPPSVPVWLVYHREMRTVARVRDVAKAIEAAFRARLPR